MWYRGAKAPAPNSVQLGSKKVLEKHIKLHELLAFTVCTQTCRNNIMPNLMVHAIWAWLENIPIKYLVSFSGSKNVFCKGHLLTFVKWQRNLVNKFLNMDDWYLSLLIFIYLITFLCFECFKIVKLSVLSIQCDLRFLNL